MLKLKLVGAVALMGLVAACQNPQQTVNTGPVCPQDPRCPPPVQLVVQQQTLPAPVRTKAVATRTSSTSVVATRQLVTTGENKTTVRVDLGLVKERPAYIPAIVAERMTDSVPSVQIVYRMEDRECQAVRAKYGDKAVTRNEAKQECTVYRGKIQKPE